ncbi:MAG TPA: hypothetical protein VMU65_11805 [Candidatus Saccharimonadales bacterium]|nr:hypothetical protein [Candidatus Saccharimonadales bacterium]
MSFPLFAWWSGRAHPRPNAPEPATEQRAFGPPEDMRIDPISGSAPAAFAPPEPSSSPVAVNFNAWGEELPGAVPDQRHIHETSTSAKGVPIIAPGAPLMRITPINVRRSGGES